MAEVLASMVVGPLVSMVKEKASSYLLNQYKVMEGLEDQHKLLKRKLPAILDVITDAEEQAAAKREGAKAWLEEVRQVAYRANDVLDEFKYEALHRKAKEQGHYKELGMSVVKLFPTHNRFVFRYRMANKLHMTLQEIDVLIAEMNAFRFKFKPQPPMSMKWRQTDAFIPRDSEEIARESRAKEKKDIVDRLLAQASSEDLMVLPIIGMGGLGKTTLAQLIYHDTKIKKHFELQLWVCVSDHFDVDLLAEKIVEENGCGATGSSALDRLKNAVSGKRYLLVLDDVWNRDEPSKWEKLKSYLQHGGSGSSVLTTTRDEAVAKLMMGTASEGAYKLKNLDVEFLEKIIKSRAFGSIKEEEWPRELVGLVGDMAKRCSGSPLAATALGSVLHSKTSKQEWDAMLNGSTISDEENGILPVLKLSYNCLPSYMRQCFAFCAMFPKDYEIDVKTLIHLWMANGFIPEQPKVCPETIGEKIFNELKSRSFFQDLKSVPFYQWSNKHIYCSKITCKIHDLMHDVAMDSMGKECATIATKMSKSEDYSYSARHLFLLVDEAEDILNASLEKGYPTFQTLIFEGEKLGKSVHKLSSYRSVRALKIKQGSFLRPKYLHQLWYLDLSGSDIVELPEDISIMYNLQTLNLSYCDNLERLPKELKYLTALRHLYTHGCEKLKSMPAGLGHLTSLQMLTCFVACNNSGCSNLRELQNLDLGGRLELSQLENVIGADEAQAACLGNKKKLTELELRWADTDEEVQNNHEEVVIGLKPPDGLKVLRIYCCGSRTSPIWMNTMNGMVELQLFDCKKLEKLPALWQLPALQVLCLAGLESLHCLCSGGTTPVTFPELKVLSLYGMPNFEAWWGKDDVQGDEPVFPNVEDVMISNCKRLTALPKAVSVITESSGGVDTECRSAFPALREMKLLNLDMFDRWEAAEGTPGEKVTFPLLEYLRIEECPMLTHLPEAPKLIKLEIGGGGRDQQISLQTAGRYIPSLSSLSLDVSPNDTETTLLRVKQKWNHKLPLTVASLGRCDLLFSSHSTEALALWTCFAQLVDLSISECDALVYWPENVFQVLVSLRKLSITNCSKLTGHTQASDEHSAPAPERGRLLPRLKSLWISNCESLVELPILPASLKTLAIATCSDNIKSIVFCQQEDTRLVSGEGVVRQETSSLIPALYSNSWATASIAVLKLSSAANHRLESLHICGAMVC